MTLHSTQLSIGLRSLLGLVFIVAMFAVFPILLHASVWLVWFTGPVIAICTFLLARNATRTNLPPGVERRPRLGGWFMLACSAIPLPASIFIRRRWIIAFSDDQWPRPFPYPDVYLMRLHDWWDRLHPVTDGLKIHGEHYAVLQGTNILVLIASAVFGLFGGYVFRDVEFVGDLRRTPSR
jgi:hypothetical protein